MAFFVEGYSEMLFVDKLVTEIAGAHKVLVEQRQVKGGVTVPKSMITVKAASIEDGHEFFVLIIDCGGDQLVKSRLLEEHEGLTKAGYEKIICIRDVRPDYSRDEIPDLERGLRYKVKTSLAPVDFVLSTMELEAWFLAEFNHYSKIDASINSEEIHKLIGYHPETDDPSLRDFPTDDLTRCYGIAGKTYTKSEVARTVEALDYMYIYTDLKDRIPAVKKVTDHIDQFLSPVVPEGV
ncbi:MAG: hypothetical protein ACOKSU_24985 [Pseudomonas sp.]